jgi:hypothetical protein
MRADLPLITAHRRATEGNRWVKIAKPLTVETVVSALAPPFILKA